MARYTAGCVLQGVDSLALRQFDLYLALLRPQRKIRRSPVYLLPWPRRQWPDYVDERVPL